MDTFQKRLTQTLVSLLRTVLTANENNYNIVIILKTKGSNREIMRFENTDCNVQEPYHDVCKVAIKDIDQMLDE